MPSTSSTAVHSRSEPQITTMGASGLVILLVCVAVCSVHAIRDPSAGSGAPLTDRKDRITYTAEAEADRVDDLPGWGKLKDFNLFSGYVIVDKEAGRQLFYAYVESAGKPATDPVVLWLNGGPGCSSLGGGFLSELGPFYPTPKGDKLQANDYAWNKVANMLFLDSPAFVGWSYSNSTEDLVTGDRQTAKDAREFLLRWFDRFPHLRDSPFWLSGESYAGHYVPNLAWEIVKGNDRRDSKEQPINLQGFLVGNAWTDPVVDNPSALEFWFTHGMVSYEARHGVNKHCDFSVIGPLLTGGEQEGEQQYVSAVPQEKPASPSSRRLQRSEEEKCDEYVNLAMQQISRVNIYDIYVDVCLPPKSGVAEARQLGLMLQGDHAGLSTRPMVHGKYDPCIDNEVELYFNRRDVQEAMHANVTGHLEYPWTTCTPLIKYSRDDLLSSMIPVYKKLLKSGKLKILVYSGDIDAIVPVIGSRAWLHDLDLPVAEEWRDWRSTTRQVGGWTVKYDGITFASVRGAGHMVPYTQPERALYLFKSWVHQRPL